MNHKKYILYFKKQIKLIKHVFNNKKTNKKLNFF
jgi:hypothetical protein